MGDTQSQVHVDDVEVRAWRDPTIMRFEARDNEPFRRCGWCGSIHPRDLLAARDAGEVCKVDRTVDWKYGWPHKVYVSVKRHEHSLVSGSYAEPDLTFAKFYNVHTLEPFLSDDEREQLFAIVGYRFAEVDAGRIRWSNYAY